MKPPLVTVPVSGCRTPFSTCIVFSAAKVLRVAGMLLLLSSAATASAQLQNVWAWTAGSKTASGASAGFYGTQGVGAIGNMPGGRRNATLWSDSAGHLWMFGGLGVDAHSITGYLNDLWRYDPATDQWTWISGAATVPSYGGGNPGIYGTLGQPDASNVPGGRSSSVGWSEADGHLWLFGGVGYDAAGTPGYLNDLWEFNTSTLQWTWYGGSQTVPKAWSGASGDYGTLGIAAEGNTPGGRSRSAACQSADGSFWLFGGSGPDAVGRYTDFLNDLWSFDPATRQWKWMGGSSTVPSSGNLYGIYGTLGEPGSQNAPGGRFDSSCWIDRNGNVRLFGGLGFLSDDFGGYLNDLWEFNPFSLQWTWMAGSATTSNHDTDGNELHDFRGQPGIYGSLGVPSSSNIPGGRRHPAVWTDWAGNFWMFGGSGFDSTGHFGLLNDLWSFTPGTTAWTWMGGDSTIPKAPDCWSTDFYSNPCGRAGYYDLEGILSSSAHPGSRADSSSAGDSLGRFWLFAGDGYDSLGVLGPLNDLWVFVPEASTQTAPPIFFPPGGRYGNAQSVRLSDMTPGATIYYTTDGTAPTANSTQYVNPISVASSQIIEAIATAPGYPPSVISAAQYAITLEPPSFSVSVNPTALTLGAGISGTVVLTLTPQNGFNSTTNFACSGAPPGVTCTFDPASLTPSGGSAVTTTLTIAASTSAAVHSPFRGTVPALGLAVLLLLLRPRRKKATCLVLLAGCLGLSVFSACGGGSGGSSSKIPVFSTITVTAVSGALKNDVQISLTLM